MSSNAGTAQATHLVPLTRGTFAQVDDEDYARVIAHKWHLATTKGAKHDLRYAHRTIVISGKKTTLTLHRFILDPPSGAFVDHLDGDGLNNTRSNLRICTPRQNAMNRRKGCPDSSSKWKGVSLKKFKTIQLKWQASLAVNKQKIYIGYFNHDFDAALAYNLMADELYGQFANFNRAGENQ